MKNAKKLAALSAALMLTVVLAGCGAKNQTPDTTPLPTENAQNTPAPTEAAQDTPTPTEAPEGVRVAPIPSAFDPMNLEDCVFPVSFTNDDIELDEDGLFVLHLTVWEQELFDAAEITGLKAGDTLTVRGTDIAVSDVERHGEIIHVNGGVEAGGVSLAPSESGGTFYETNEEVTDYDIVYTSVAQLSLPVDGDNFVYTDYSDPTASEAGIYLAGDLLTMKDEVDFSTTAMNGTAHIVNNQVAEITRIYTP